MGLRFGKIKSNNNNNNNNKNYVEDRKKHTYVYIAMWVFAFDLIIKRFHFID